MSEKILKALMELFAIIASPEGNDKDRRSVVLSFLGRQLNQDLVKDYIKIFDTFYEKHQALNIERGNKRIGADSVKVLRICNDINKELAQKQKVIVLVQLFEFVKSNGNDISDQEFAFITAVAESFYIPPEEYTLIRDFTLNTFDNIPESKELLVVNNSKKPSFKYIKHFYSEYLTGNIWIIHIASAGMYFLRYIGENELYLNSQIIQQDKVFTLTTGTSIRNHHVKPLYFSDIVSVFKEDEATSRIVFEAEDVSYRFKGGNAGIHHLSFCEESGRLVGIMGSSGAGKSTLLNILNGSMQPAEGRVLINGVDIYRDKVGSNGLIGHVSQDDLLIEELTVYQNLYFNTKLCFDNYSAEQITEAVNNMLQNLGLYDIKDVQVGTPLNKKISGGQRKRLNIALELIREPAILFLDEPTSGLSSRDSENIMDLLKDLTLKGKLVFVVIHQPSSDIFKMFDNLLILDTGGYLIYNGNPVDSITYFKSKVHQANWADSECHICGNVNPEQIFNIVESMVIDEYGKETRTRKISPEEWFGFFRNAGLPFKIKPVIENLLPPVAFKVPNLFKQLGVFITRDVLAKIANTQYLIITLLEAPVLAFILAFIIKYFNISETNETGYTLMENSNLPVYLFMSVIVATFMGLTLSAEEIIKDRKILKREAFLNLSWSGYLLSKLMVMMTISAIQALTFVIIGNSVLEVRGMYFKFWLILFSAWTASNVMGLLISDSFKTVVTIYILIPFLVIPQIVLSGVIVKYEKLNPKISSPSKIPFYGEMMTARWGYEALAVEQFMHNDYDEPFYAVNKAMSIAEYKKNYWIKNLENKIDFIENDLRNPGSHEKTRGYLELLRNELLSEIPNIKNIPIQNVQNIDYPNLASLNLRDINQGVIDSTRRFIKTLNKIYIRIYNNANDAKDNLIRIHEQTPADKFEFLELKRHYHNEKLTEFVENNTELIRIIEYKGRLFQKTDPIYLDPVHPFIKAHFYAPRKMIFGKYYSTFIVNVLVIWCFSLFLYLLLYFRVFKKILDLMEQLTERDQQI
ncbi:MAG TPA: ATP-binding cassette domain-containing protein [Bacteroidales bacterium]|nr:ATP-binding cassette domain-containing protein [Bacteroidales bacterium]